MLSLASLGLRFSYAYSACCTSCSTISSTVVLSPRCKRASVDACCVGKKRPLRVVVVAGAQRQAIIENQVVVYSIMPTFVKCKSFKIKHPAIPEGTAKCSTLRSDGASVAWLLRCSCSNGRRSSKDQCPLRSR